MNSEILQQQNQPRGEHDSAAAARPPGPHSADRGVGHLDALRDDFLGYTADLSRRFGDCVYYRVGLVPVFQFTHPDQIQEVLVTRSRSFRKTDRFKGVFGRWLGRGLLLNEGESWAEQRRIVQPLFQPQQVPSYAAAIVRQTNRQLDTWAGREVNVAIALQRLTLLTTAETLFGVDLSDVADRFVDELATIQSVAYADFTRRSIAAIAAAGDDREPVRRSIEFLQGVVSRIIAERRQNTPTRYDVFAALERESLAAGDEPVQRRLRDETMMLLLAGTSTTATAVTWALYTLAEHPDVQQRVVAEIEAQLAGRAADGETVRSLRLTESAFFEALRLYPPAYTTSRQAIEPVAIGGYRLPLGAQVHLLPLLTHRDSRWFDAPDQFRPERFAAEAKNRIPRFAFIPFGAGPRACIGGGMALMHGLLVVATILQRCRLELAAGQGAPELQPRISLHPAGGIRLRFELG